MVIWITGLSDSGKTTLSRAIFRKFKKKFPHIISIDSDEVREVLGNNKLSFKESDRYKKARSIQKLIKILNDQKLIVIVSILYSHPKLLQWNRKNLKDYFEILIDVPLKTVIKRDSKKLYSKYYAGKIKNIVGIDVKWHKPKNPNLIINENLSVKESLSLITKKVKFK